MITENRSITNLTVGTIGSATDPLHGTSLFWKATEFTTFLNPKMVIILFLAVWKLKFEITLCFWRRMKLEN